jgi:hypothetical protein
MRSTSETTIRQQALSIHRKSRLKNRSELSAFFLEDLLLPAGQRLGRERSRGESQPSSGSRSASNGCWTGR